MAPQFDTPAARTLLLPLAARADFSRRHPELFRDAAAERLAGELGLGALPGASGWAGALYALRQDALCAAARRYLARRPGALLLDLGCGLDAPFPRVDNGRCRYLGLDLPEVIALRRRLLPPGERERYLAADARGLSWLEGIDGSQGLFVLAGGLFGYFRERELRALLCALAERFPGGGVCFDAAGPLSLAMSNAVSRREGGTPMRFALRGCERALRPWSAHFGEISPLRRLPEPYSRPGALPARIRLALSLALRMGELQLVEIAFRG